jgi:hypothetical protein
MLVDEEGGRRPQHARFEAPPPDLLEGFEGEDEGGMDYEELSVEGSGSGSAGGSEGYSDDEGGASEGGRGASKGARGRQGRR